MLLHNHDIIKCDKQRILHFIKYPTNLLINVYPCSLRNIVNIVFNRFTSSDAYGRYLRTKNGQWLACIEGILPKGPYLLCVSMAGSALLTGYPRYVFNLITIVVNKNLLPDRYKPITLSCNHFSKTFHQLPLISLGPFYRQILAKPASELWHE